MRNIDLATKLLNEVSKINEIEDIELVNIAEDVDAYIGLKIKSKDIKDRYKILEKLNDLECEIYKTSGVLLIIYWEFEYYSNKLKNDSNIFRVNYINYQLSNRL